MATSTLIVDYLGVGLAVNLPVAPNVPSTGSAFYYETDTPALRVWDGSAWQPVIVGAASGTVTHTGGALTDHGILVGNGADDIAALGVMTNGQLLIGHTGADPDLATLTAGAGITITNAAGSITIANSTLGTVTHTGGALTAHAPMVGAGSADSKTLAAMTDGQLMIGSTGADPAITTLTPGTGIAITNGAGGIQINIDSTVTLHTGGPITQYAVQIGGISALEIDNGPVLTDGQVLMGVTGAAPTGTTIASGNGITVTSTGGGITVKQNDTAVTPGSYGDGTHIPTFTVDQQGHITAASSTAVTVGGTVTHTGGALTNHAPMVGAGSADSKALAAMTDGQLMIGTTGADPTLATLTAGTGVTITNAAGSITISAPAGSGTVTHTGGALTNHAPMVGAGSADSKALAAMTDGQLMIGHTGADPDLATLTAGSGVTITNAAGSITIAATGTGGTVTHTGGALTNHAPMVGAGSADSKALAAMTDGQLMIGTTGADPTLATLTAGSGVTITNAAGSITIAATGAGGTVTHTAGALTAHAPMVGAGSADSKALAAMTDGQLMIGHTGADPDLATITAGAGITVTNAAGSITIANSTLGTVTHTPGALTANAFVFGNAADDIKATAAATNGQLLIGSTGANPVAATLTAGSGVTITNAAGSITIAATGSGGTVTNTGGSFTTHGILLAAGAGDAKSTASPTNGQLLIGHTGADPDLATLTAGTGITITNAAGGITIASTVSGGSTTFAGDTDVAITSIADKDLITYDSGTSKYINKGRTIVGSYQWHPACDYATMVPLPANTYANGTSGVGATLTGNANGALSPDGTTVTVGQRILVGGEATASHNGIYVVTTVGSGGAAYVLTRASDADNSVGAYFGSSSQFFVSGGNLNATGIFAASTNADPIVFGTTTINFSILCGKGQGLYASVMSPVTPTQANTGLTTWMNQGSAVATDHATGFAIQGVASQDWQVLKKAAASTPYTLTALVVFNTLPSNFIGVGIGFTDGTKLHIIHLQSSNNIITSKWTNTTTFSANDTVASTQNLQGVPVWLRITDDGTTVKFYYSYDGGTWVQNTSISRASGFLGSSGYTNNFFGVNSNTPACNGSLLSWTYT